MNPSTSAAVFESYVRTPDFEAIAAGLELSPELWDIFARTEQRVSAAGIAGPLGVTPEIALLGLRELAQHRLLRKHVQRWNEYRGGAAASAPAPTPALMASPVVAAPVPASVAVFATVPPPLDPPVAVLVPAAPREPSPTAAAVQPVAEPPKAPAVRPVVVPATAAHLLPAVRPLPVAVTRPREVRFVCGPKAVRRRPPAEPSGLIRFAVRRAGVVFERRKAVAVGAALASSAAADAGWRLRPLLDAIVRRGGGGVSGQLLAYRVFLRVPAELLDRAGLHSLNLVDDHFVIRDPELHAAIRRSMSEVAGLEDDTSAATAPCSVS